MKNKLWVLGATAAVLLLLGGAAQAEDACQSFKQALLSRDEARPGSHAKGLIQKLAACRAQNLSAGKLPGKKQDSSGTFIVFPIAGSSLPNPTAITAKGYVSGNYFDADNMIHSFLRTPDGTISTFDPPGTSCSPFNNGCSSANDMNSNGTIVGSYQPTSAPGQINGYLVDQKGFTSINFPGALGGTQPVAINQGGAVTGGYAGSDFFRHGFLRSSSGIFTAFDPFDAIATQADSINASETISGLYADASFNIHGFVRSKDGSMTRYDTPGYVMSLPPTRMNAKGDIVGGYCGDAGCNSFYGFLRASDGTITTIGVPGDTAGTVAMDINEGGDITGNYFPPDFLSLHGYLRTRQGEFINFDVPGMIVTYPTAMNESGMVTGTTCDESGTCQVFIWKK